MSHTIDPSNIIVYCSGPMFSPADKWFQSKLAKALEDAGFKTYLPQRDGIEVGFIMNLLQLPTIRDVAMFAFTDVMRFVEQAGFALDIFNVLKRCDALVFNMDGRVPDGGSVVEAAVAYTGGKPLVIYKNTPISELSGFDNPMITGLSSSWEYVNDLSVLDKTLTGVIEKTPPSPFQGDAMPPHLRKIIAYGEKVSMVVTAIHELQNSLEGTELAKYLEKLMKELESTAEHKAAFGGSGQ